MKLFGDRLLVKPLVAATTSAGGIELPETARARYHRSQVVKLGEGVPEKERLPLKVGDVVLHFAIGPDFQFQGETLKLLSESDLFGVE